MAGDKKTILDVVKEVEKSPYEYMDSTGFGKTISGGRLHERVEKAEALKEKAIPELKDNIDLKVLLTALTAVTSYEKKAVENWQISTHILRDYIDSGAKRIMPTNPDVWVTETIDKEGKTVPIEPRFAGWTTRPATSQQLN